MSTTICRLCKSPNVREHLGYRNLNRVTSDCKPWKAGGRLITCRACGCTQVICDEEWQEAIDSIYNNYTIYYQGEGEEQKVFDSTTGRTLPRSEWLLERMAEHVRLPAQGRGLDIGCGNGRFLKAFGALHKGWRLIGTEFGDKYRHIVEALPGVDKLHTGSLESLPGVFDLISLIHVLEHIEEPQALLREIAAKFSPEGYLFVELPSYESNPFELLIVDHATHYTLQSVDWILAQAGMGSLVLSESWVSKELSILARPGNGTSASALPSESALLKVEESVSWLHGVASQARAVAAAAPRFGVFGTSIAGTWLASELKRPPAFFVDEDPNRIGHDHLGVPVLAPDQVSPGSVVFVAQPTPIAEKIAARLVTNGVEYICPVAAGA